MTTIAPAPRGRSNIDENVAEVLKMWEARISKDRHSGIVSKVSGTTTFIQSGDREFLAWSKPELTVGTPVEFSIDQLQAVRVKVRKETPSVKPEVLAELPQPQSEAMDPEIGDESESVTTMGAAFKQLEKVSR